MKTKVLFAAGVVFALTLHIDQAFAQAPPGVFADANHPSTAPDPEKLSQIWQVDPITGQVSIMIPFGTTPQAGRGPRIPFALMYNSGSTITLQAFGSHFLPGFTPFVYQNTENYEWAPPQGSSSSGPWTTTGPFYHFYESTLADETTPLGQTTGKGCSVRGPYIYTDENGASHDMNLELSETGHQSGLIPPCQDAANASDQYGASSATSDGSALQTDSGGNVTYPDGERYIAPVTTTTGTLEDSNGNTASISIDNSGAIAVTDSLGRTPFSTNIPVGMTRGSALIPTGTYTVTTTGANAASEAYTVVFSSVPIGSFSMPHPTNSEVYDNTYCYSQGCPTGYSVSVAPAGTTFSALTSIRLPDDESSYTFAYDPVFGTISKITFPTGGYVRFAWAVRNHGMAPHGSFEAMSDIIVTDVWTSDGGTENHWSYKLDSYSSAPPSSAVTNPDGTYVRYTGQCFIYSRVPLYLYGSMPSCKVASSATYASGGTLEQSELETFSNSGQLYQDAVTSYTPAGAVQRITQYLRNSYGNVTEKDESQFFACNGAPCAMPTSPPGGWARKTITAYLWSSPNPSQPSYNYAQAHIIDTPSQITVTDGSGNPVSMVRYNYDEGATLAGSSGVLHHDDTHYPATMIGPRGNLTSETRCAAFAGGIL